MSRWTPPAEWRRITTVDAHTAGEPLRLITSGWPEPEGDTILAKRRFAREHQDDLRRALMWEPRGHADMYGCLPTVPVTSDGDLGCLFLHNEGFSTMCGHGIIALVQVGVELGFVRARDGGPTIRIDTPAGRVTATAHRDGESVERVSFENVPSFLAARERTVEVEGLGPLTYDLAFGGAYYAYVAAPSVGLEVRPENTARLIEVGMAIKRAVAASHPIEHPLAHQGDEEDLGFLYGTILHEPGEGGAHTRNVCIFAEGEVDRSPTGTGVSGWAAVLHARGELALERSITIESLLGTRFDVRLLRETELSSQPAVVPEVTGRAWLTGRHEFLIDPTDPLGGGFLLR